MLQDVSSELLLFSGEVILVHCLLERNGETMHQQLKLCAELVAVEVEEHGCVVSRMRANTLHASHDDERASKEKGRRAMNHSRKLWALHVPLSIIG